MIRDYQPGDHLAIAEIFCRAIHEVASACYTPAQCAAWSDKAANPGHWEQRCAAKLPFVFETQGEVAGFLELDDDGHIDCMYVHPDHGRKGIASRLIDHAVRRCEENGVGRMYVEASHCARPVFEKKGFRIVKQQTVPLRGEELVNFVMERYLDASSSGEPR